MEPRIINKLLTMHFLKFKYIKNEDEMSSFL